MDLQKFRILHSTLIEHYQFIESHLEGIYATLSGKSFSAGLEDVEQYSISKIIKAVQALESKLDKRVISDAEYEKIKAICLRRNFWVHNCYYDMAFDRKTGGPKHQAHVEQMYSDIQAAETMRELLFERKMQLFHVTE